MGVPAAVPSPKMLNIPQVPLPVKPGVRLWKHSVLSSEIPQVLHRRENDVFLFFLAARPLQHSYPEPLVERSLALVDSVEKGLPEQNSFSNIPHEGKHTPLYERSSPINPGQAGSPNHTEAAFFNASSASSSSENEESSGTTAK